MSNIFVNKDGKNDITVTVMDRTQPAQQQGSAVYKTTKDVPLNPALSQNPSQYRNPLAPLDDE